MDRWARLALLLLIAAGVWWPTLVPTRYQYALTAITDASWQLEMDRRGADGWELVFARRANDGESYAYECIFRRVE